MSAIVRALMARPRILPLDELSMGLAPVLVETIFRTIIEINREGTTILLVEQNAAMALQIAQRGYVPESGTVVLEASARDLLNSDSGRRTYLGEEWRPPSRERHDAATAGGNRRRESRT